MGVGGKKSLISNQCKCENFWAGKSRGEGEGGPPNGLISHEKRGDGTT